VWFQCWGVAKEEVGCSGRGAGMLAAFRWDCQAVQPLQNPVAHEARVKFGDELVDLTRLAGAHSVRAAPNYNMFWVAWSKSPYLSS